MRCYPKCICQTLVIICVFYLGVASAPASEDKRVVCRSIPNNTVIITKEAVSSNSMLSRLKWPNYDQINNSEVAAVNNSVVELVAREYVQKIMKPKCIPDNFLELCIPLRHHLEGADAVLARYEYSKYYVQLFITSSYIRMIVREESPTIREARDEKITWVRRVVKEFFKNEDKLLHTFDNPVRKNGGVQGGDIDLRNVQEHGFKTFNGDSDFEDVQMRWSQQFKWWTSGSVIYFKICIDAGTSSGGVDDKEWFARVLSREKGLIGKKESLTKEVINNVLELDTTKKDGGSAPQTPADRPSQASGKEE